MIYGTLIVIVGGLIVCLCKMKRFKKKVMKLYRIGKVKLRTIFFVFQVISSFASISKDTGAQVKYPQPAASVAAAMGAANLDLFSFVSLRCMLPDTHFYTNLLIKTTTPFAVIALLFTYPLVHRASRKPYQKAWQTSARLSLFMLELVRSLRQRVVFARTTHHSLRWLTSSQGLGGVRFTHDRHIPAW